MGPYALQKKRPVRRPFVPEVGKVYRNRGGGDYLCICYYNSSSYFVNVDSGWQFEARGLGMYEDGTIDWDHSVGGFFTWM